MKVKCFSIYEDDKQLLSEYANPSQQEFLDFQLKGVMKTLKKTNKIEFQNTANGVWYIRQCPMNSQLVQVMLISKQASSVAMAANFFNNVTELQQNLDVYKNKEKLRMKISEIIKLSNANKKIDSLNSNVMELQEIMKGSVNKMVNNMTELDSAERKSSAMAQLSIQFERDAKELEKKMKRRKFLFKLLIAGTISIIIGIAIYVLFL